MTRERSLFAGMTDYTGVSLDDIVEHLGDWRRNADAVISHLRIIRDRLEPLAAEPQAREGLEYIDYFIDLFGRYRSDLDRLASELPRAVLPRHIDLVEQLYMSSKSEEQFCVAFKREQRLDFLDQRNEVQMMLAEAYATSRDAVIYMRDLSNVLPRLRTFVRDSAEREPVGDSAVNALELKPNFFGLGLNLNYIWERWRRRKH